jgi:hypothetical protein
MSDTSTTERQGRGKQYSHAGESTASLGTAYWTPAATGRPSEYSLERAAEVLDRLASGESLTRICRDDHMPVKTTVYKWLRERPPFMDQYQRARVDQADSMFDDIVQISDDDDDPRRAKVRIDARMWAAARLRPKVYGDTKHVQVDHTVTLTDDQLDARLAALSRQAGVVIDGEFDVVVQHDEPEMLECDHNTAPQGGGKDT